MNKEIKEILVKNDELIVYYNDNSFIIFDTLTLDVLDYISNLQRYQEDNFLYLYEELQDKVLKLQEENEKLLSELTRVKSIKYTVKDTIYFNIEELMKFIQTDVYFCSKSDKND